VSGLLYAPVRPGAPGRRPPSAVPRQTLAGHRTDTWHQARFGVENQARARLQEAPGEPRAAAPRTYSGGILVGCVSASVAGLGALSLENTRSCEILTHARMSDIMQSKRPPGGAAATPPRRRRLYGPPRLHPRVAPSVVRLARLSRHV